MTWSARFAGTRRSRSRERCRRGSERFRKRWGKIRRRTRDEKSFQRSAISFQLGLFRLKADGCSLKAYISSPPVDVLVQELNRHLLRVDVERIYVADGDHSVQPPRVIAHGEMSDASLLE